MLIEEEPKSIGEINPDALEDVFDENVSVEEDVVMFVEIEEDEDEIDIAFQADDSRDW